MGEEGIKAFRVLEEKYHIKQVGVATLSFEAMGRTFVTKNFASDDTLFIFEHFPAVSTRVTLASTKIAKNKLPCTPEEAGSLLRDLASVVYNCFEGIAEKEIKGIVTQEVFGGIIFPIMEIIHIAMIMGAEYRENNKNEIKLAKNILNAVLSSNSIH